MAAFSYKIRLTTGKLEQGLVQAGTQLEAIAKVHKLGGVVLEVKQTGADGAKKGKRSPKISLKERIIFTEQLAVMLKAGITLVQALKGIQEETTNKNLAAILSQMVADVEGGLSLSKALAHHPRVFSHIYCQMIASAEKTGNVAEVLGKLTTQQQKEYELRGKVKGALIYPAIISVLLVSVIIMVITFILPKLSGIFAESGASLPWSTKFLLSLSDVFTHQWYIIIGVLLVIYFSWRMTLRTEKGLYAWDMLKIRIPILGGFLKKSYMAGFCQSFASLAQAGVPMLEIFETVRGVVGNTVYEKEIDRIAADVSNGLKVSVAIRKSKYFPGMVGQLVSVGEQSGDMAGIFVVLGDFFEKEVDTMAKNLSTIIEPVIMVVMGAGVGFVLISVLQPIFNLSNAI